MPHPSVSTALAHFLATLRPGDVVGGVVVRIETFGVQIDLDRGPRTGSGFRGLTGGVLEVDIFCP